ncbi:MAG: 3-deoxy-7-phosphoheptulonate synthase [Firmicutes bacterium HGW-Firmicutes-12]|nr:MAG: 3-deoxy-7-phosphoheptulonate synthase [Firmicutes bacterium HGW-Firmicutes-12]
MIVVFRKSTDEEKLQNVVRLLTQKGFITEIVRGTEKTIIGAVGDKSRLLDISLEALDGVEKVIPILAPYKLASREFKPIDTIVRVGDLEIGGSEIIVMAGPCAVESKEQLIESAVLVKRAGAQILRGGAFKPRSSPYSFQGLEKKGLEYLALAREKTGMPIVTEVIDARSLEQAVNYTDILQIGARNMQNFSLLQEAAEVGKPILLKRGISASLEEWILAAEYILKAGNPQVILCERGIRTFETYTRNTLDLSAVPAIKQLTHLPIIVDPSHSTGKWQLVHPMTLGAVACGADGILIEVHPNPTEALCDGPQSLSPEKFKNLMQSLAPVAKAVNRELNLNDQ